MQQREALPTVDAWTSCSLLLAAHSLVAYIVSRLIPVVSAPQERPLHPHTLTCISRLGPVSTTDSHVLTYTRLSSGVRHKGVGIHDPRGRDRAAL